MVLPPLPRRAARVVSQLAYWCVLACAPAAGPRAPAPTPAAASASTPIGLEPNDLRAWVTFLSDDAQQGRAPGTAADARVREFVAARMREFGLEPAGSDGFMQPFTVTDGVRLRPGGASRLHIAGADVPHHLVPFGGDTGSSAARGRLVFVGHGVLGEGGEGDYAGLDAQVNGSIVVALAGGPDDPHISPAALRAQSKLIAARDRGAVGFVLWDPQTDTPPANHGLVADLKLPAVFVGAAGTPALLRAFAAAKSSAASLPVGKRSKAKVELATPIEPVVVETANVVARLPGNGERDQQVVVGAHLDHLGMGTESSLAPGRAAIHNGADDNASGVATMLGVARAYASRPRSERPHDVVFVAFGAEEMGLLGSKHMVESMSVEQRERTLAMLNFDMVGRLGSELFVHGTGTAKEWESLLGSIASDLPLAFVSDGHGPSDHAAFYEAEIPVLHFFTGPHEDYHRPTDDVDKIDFDGAARVGVLALGVLERVARADTKLSYVETEAKGTARGGFRISLGTMPDYAADVDGLRLAGVRKGGAAEKGGLEKGDVIVQIGEREIHGIDDYMASFAVLAPGKPVTVVILRDGEKRELVVVPAAPAR